MSKPRKLLAGVTASLLALSVVSPVQATHNLTNRIWDYSPSGSYDYAPRYTFVGSFPSLCQTMFRAATAKWNLEYRELRFVEGTGSVWLQAKYFDLGWPFNDDLAFTWMDVITNISWAELNFNTSVDYGGGTLTPWCGTATPGPSQYDLLSVAIHELGHTHEQKHTSSTADIMYPSISPGTTKRTLSSHDRASLYQLYAAVQ